MPTAGNNNKQQLSPNHHAQESNIAGGVGGGGGPNNANVSCHSPSSPMSANVGVGGGGGSPYNGSQTGGNSGGVSPNAMGAAGISPSKYRRSMSYPTKAGLSPTAHGVPPGGYGMEGVPQLSVGNGAGGCMTDGASGRGDAPYLGSTSSGNGMDMHSLDHCLSDIMRNIGAVGPGGDNMTAAVLAERIRNQKLSEHHLSEADALAMSGGYAEGMKLSSPSRASPHSPNSGSEQVARYSRKVFVGGLPPDIDEDEITTSFRRFGPLLVDWPHKAESKSYFPPKGYAFLLFQDENSVQQLIDTCITDDNKLYLCVSSPTIKDKPVQIRPWRLADADYVLDATMSLDPRKTVFVGGVPRPLKAVELAMIMDGLYGGVCYAGIDTDPDLKYPKGAGRVAFSNQQSYIAAISARFVQLQHGDIDKRVEVKPYVLDDQMCDECEGARCGGKFAPFFCANVTCLQYYCEHCWAVIHSRLGREYHKPLVKEGADRPRAVPFRW